MKIDPIFYEDYLKNKFENINIIFLYGTNIGLVNLTYEKTLKILEIDTNDPFSVSKIDGDEFKDNPSILHDNINTLGIFSEKRFILLDLMMKIYEFYQENWDIDAVQERYGSSLIVADTEIVHHVHQTNSQLYDHSGKETYDASYVSLPL